MSNVITSATAISPGLRRFLYITAALTGAAVLIVEILGAKMLSPYVGTSHFVWTAQITVTLVGLAVGYYFGGWLVDRSSNLSRLYLCILGAAVYLAFSAGACERVAYFFLQYKLATGALLASATLFFIPLTLLAAVCPFLVRILATSFNVIGGQVGRLSAISTFGSVAGTLLIGYVLLPFLPNSVTMFITAGGLALLVAVYFIAWGNRKAGPYLAAAFFLIAGFGVLGWRVNSTPKWPNLNEIYHANSNFGMLQVVERTWDKHLYYLNDFLVQNTYDPAEKKSTSLFTYMLRYLAFGYRTNLHDALCIGMGVGIVPRELAEAGVKVDVVEINPAVVPVATKYFGFQPDKLSINIGDGRYFVNATEKKYDALILDAFLGDSSPSHLMTREAFTQMRRVLRPGGVLVINSFGEFQSGLDFLTTSLHKTLLSVFPSVKVHATGNGNVFFVASDQARLVLTIPPNQNTHPEVASDVDSCFDAVISPSTTSGMILTDDFNPIDFYDAKNREQHRKRLALAFRRS
jgi:spermidine synthase